MDMQTSAVSWLDMSESYDCTCEALSIIYGTQESDMNTFKAFVYEGYLMESGATRDIVMEGAFDIFKSIADGIKKFIERIKEFFKKILLYITAAYDDLDKVAKQAEPIVKNMKEVDFTIDGYKFTVLDTSGPNIKEFQNIVSEYNSDMEDLAKVKDAEIKKKLLDWMSDSHLDKLRAEVLGVSTSITEDDYLDEIRKYYRDGEDSSGDIKVTKSMVMDIIGHAKRLEDVKKAAIKDRDNLIALLSRTETFFNKNLPTMYRGNQMQGNTAKISVADNKFSKEDNYQNVTDSSVKLITTYATFKSRQVNKIASMINLVACERVNALRDQIKQERVVLRKCLFNDKREDVKVEESAIQIFPNIGYNGRCFTTYAMESNVIDSKAYDAISQMVLLNEATFLTQSALTNRVHYLMEADMDSGLGKVKSAIGAIIESVVAAFRKKAIGEASKYKPWLDEIKGGLADKAKEKKEFKMANFADADYNAMANTIVSSIRKAYASKDYNDTSFAKDIINSFDSFEKINDDSSRALMLNYFRTGKADAKLDIATFNGSSLAGKVPEMIKYIEQYGNNVTKPAENISSTFKTQNEAFKVTESFMNGSTFLDLIGKPICESEVVLCTDYNEMFSPVSESKHTIVTEDTDIGGKVEGLGKAGAEAVKAAGGEGAKESNQQAEEVKSATQVSSTDDPKVAAENGTAEKKTNNAAVTYKKNVDRFFKNCITLYIKAREEQFLAYVNALSEIDGGKPKFDKNGKYLSKEKEKKEDEAAVQTESK